MKKLKKRISCSVCIANYNGINVIGSCINSVLDQDINLPYEVIIHDDASTDDSVSFIKKHYPEIRLIESSVNVGFCVSNNRMANQAHGDFLLILNNDAVLHKDALRTLYNYSNRQTVPGIIGLPQYDIQTGKLIDIGSFLDPFLNPIPNLNKKKQKVATIIGACLWVPKSLWQEIGGFPEILHTLSEDIFLCSVARIKGYSVTALAESGFDHWVGYNLSGRKLKKGGLHTTFYRRSLTERNKSFVMFICYPSPAIYLLFPIHIFLLITEGMLLTLIKKDLRIWSEIYCSCMKSLWKERKCLLSMRSEIQSQSRISCRGFFSVFTFLPHKLRMLLKYGLPKLD